MRARQRAVVFSLVALFYLAAGTYKASHFSLDFIPVYLGARCLVHGCNPYDPPQLNQQYVAAHGTAKLMRPDFWVARPSVYPPSTFLTLSPLALLPFRPASVIWALLGGSALIMAMAFMISISSRDGSWALTLFGIFVLIMDIGLLGTGNPATFACSLAVIGAGFFLIGRYLPLGTVLLTLSLAVKPQVAGLIILYLLVRGIGRRWAALSLGGGLAFLLTGILVFEMHAGSQHWLTSLRANLAECVQPGHVNDPTPTNPQLGLTNLQTLTSVFLANPKAWNAAAWAITLLLFTVWIVSIRKLGTEPASHFLALPPLLVLSLFPVYHRSCDVLILLLSFPMIVRVLRGHKVLGGCILLLTALPIFSDDFAWPIAHAVGRFWNLTDALSHKAVFILLMRPYSLQLLLLFGLYLVAMRVLSAESRAGAEVQHAIPVSHA